MERALLQFLAFLTFFISTFGFSILLYSIILRFAHTLGIREKDTVVRWASTSKPALGGIVFYIVFLVSFVCQSILIDEGEFLTNIRSFGALGAASLAFVMGLADDAYNTRPLLKFLVQLSCGWILIATGTYIHLFEQDYLNYLLTIFWVVGIMNSINMLDNMDGITTVTSMFILLIAMVFMALHGLFESADFIVMLGVSATLFAFLFFNWNPSKMYMGDTGSQFLGIVLAIAGIRYFWNSTLIDGSVSQWQQIVALLIGFSLPIIDTTIVSINRISRKQSPFVGGKDHTTHNLSYLGLSDSQVALIYTGLSALNLACCYIIFRFVNEWNLMTGLLLSIYPLSIFVAFFILCRRQRHFYTEIS
ncbi:MAG: undecaprenyl/decaprenyl-phosphate alpha-N-acetylglucosaminyl 1-phosphate transferase [Flavobacteriales bacterium]|nr:undecaprenyl/decaprenyl-phosphate alpha-N-acetylglucosaminyl 1-phosphate transferase [Flavobacteriales bacterium]NNK80104.1 undecaprenyl/decaprenyl-phosphate alpha-N-acetylglucosaminyl 1-phosphate transferase [Flavobacteriales bacterium]